MNVRATEVATHQSLDDEFAALFGDYAEPAPKKEDPEEITDALPPRLFADTFEYASVMIERLSRPGEKVFTADPNISIEERLIKITIPDDMRARDGFGYASEGAVDSRYMPEEAVGPGDKVELTDHAQVINRAIDAAKMQERSWPTVQYLWDGHPIIEWFSDVRALFSGALRACRPLSAAFSLVKLLFYARCYTKFKRLARRRSVGGCDQWAK